MAQLVYRANLAARSFPLLPSDKGNTVIVSGSDQAYSRWGTPAEKARDVNVPDAFYMQNFIATTEGYASIGYSPIPATFAVQFLQDSPYDTSGPGPYSDLSAYQFLQAVNGTSVYDIIESFTGLFYYKLFNTSVYALAGGNVVHPSASNAEGNTSYTQVGGATYGFFQSHTAAPNTFNIWDGANWVDAVPLGLAVAAVTCIVGSNGYNIACSGVSVAWSSTTNPVDFVPSIITGAGGAAVQELAGPIKHAVACAFGFILYSELNAVSAVYTGNSRFPFKFSEIKGAGGFISQRLIVASDNLGYQVAITRSGLQKLATTTSETFLPELNDFIFSPKFEEWNYLTNTFVQQTDVGHLRIPAGRLALIASRYLLYSYNSVPTASPSSKIYDYAFLYDIQLERWGKFKRNHVQIYGQQRSSFSVQPAISTYKAINFLSAGGATNGLILGGGASGGNPRLTPLIPVIVFGKYQYVRSRHMVLDSVRVGNVDVPASLSAGDCSISDIVTLDEGAQQPISAGYLATSNTQLEDIKYNFSLDARTHILVVKGAWNLSNLELTFHVGGKV